MIGEAVSVFGSPDVEEIPTTVMIRLAENGFKMHYNEKDFIADTVDEMLGMVEKWFKDSIKEKELKIK